MLGHAKRMYAIMVFCSFMSYLQFLRFVPKVRVLIRTIFASIKESLPFFSVLIVMLLNFSATFYFNDGAAYPDDGVASAFEAI